MSDPREIRGGEHLSSDSSQTAPTGCQLLPVWLEVCAGTMPGDVAMTHLQHAADCRDCSGLLAEANAILSPDPSPEEQSVLDRLETSSPTCQRHLAKLLHNQISEPHKHPAPRRSWKSSNLFLPVLAWGATAACVFAIAVFLLVRQPSRPTEASNAPKPSEPSDATLLAQAWNLQRSSQLRLPGTNPEASTSVTRSVTTRDAPSPLLVLILRNRAEINKQPHGVATAAQRQTSGRIALVEGNGQEALNEFSTAYSLDNNLPGITFDLASANFELAESNPKRTDYNDNAIELYSTYLGQVNKTDPVALYNRALCWQRKGVTTDAIADLQAALALEKDPRWRRKIQDDLDGLRQATAQSSIQQPLSVADFLSTEGDPPGLYEQYLSLASREWLPRRGTDPQIDTALQKLTVLGSRRHNDRWIEDMLAVPESEDERTADRALADALTAAATGNTDADLAASARAADLYRRLDNQAGYARAAIEHLYALQRMGRAADCLREASALSGNPELARGSWLHIYLQLATSGAYNMLGDLERDRLIDSAAAQTASDNGLPISSLRATGFLVYNDIVLKHYMSASREAAAALRSSQNVQGASMPRFQILYNLRISARDLNLPWTRRGLAEAAAAEAGATVNRKTAAYALEQLGLDDIQVGDLSGAQRSFQSADNLLATLGNGPASQRFAADWTSDRALLVARTQGPDSAVAMLARYEPAMRSADAFEPRVHFYTEYADLLRQSNQGEVSLRQVLKAITDAERSLSEIRAPADRTAWPERTRKAYEVLVADLAEDPAHPALALRAWEWLQSAPFREGQPLSTAVAAGITPAQLDSTLPPLPNPQPGSVTLVLARVLDHYILWSVTDARQPVHQYILPADPASVTRLADTFLRLCADPHSPIDDITLLGQSLYADLLSPADDLLSQTHSLSLDVDPSLTAIPFPALQHHGRYFGADYALTLLPGSWVLHSRPADDRLPPQPRLALLLQSPITGQPSISGDDDESAEIKRLFPKAHLERATLSRDGPELALSGLPGLRSVLSHADAIHYVGHGLDETSAPSGSDPALELSAGMLPHTRLAVLAACRTLSEREETAVDVPSFARILMAAGASHVLATQWDVDSRMTSSLMKHFYAMLAQGTTFSEALRQSQQSLQSDPTSAHPYFWSGFQLIGNP